MSNLTKVAVIRKAGGTVTTSLSCWFAGTSLLRSA